MSRATLILVLALGMSLVAEDAGVAVLELKAVGLSRETGAAAAELLCTELSMVSRITLVERTALRRILQERAMQSTDLADGQAAELAKLAGAKYVLVGSVIKTNAVLTMAVRMIDVGTGGVVIARSVTGRGEDDIPRMCRELAESLAAVELRALPIDVTGAAVIEGKVGKEGAEAAAIAEAVRKWVETYGSLPERVRACDRARREGRKLTEEDERLLTRYGPWLDKMRRWPVRQIRKPDMSGSGKTGMVSGHETIVGQALFLVSGTKIRNFVVERDTIELQWRLPGVTKRLVVQDFELKEQSPKDFDAKALRRLLSEAGFEVSPPKENLDKLLEVRLTYWLR